MPELPEVETMRRGIIACQGATITKLLRPRCRLKPVSIQPALSHLRRRIVGSKIAAIERLGKRLILRLDHDQRLIFEPRMTGLLLLTAPPDPQHLRLCLELAPHDRRRGPQKLLFWDRRGLGTVRLFTPGQFASQLGPQQLGPDALEITAAQFRTRLGESRREIKVGLLDQKAIAGIGNIYAAEILFTARIHPCSSCRRLRSKDWGALARATRTILNKAIRYEGSTLNDGTYRNALNRQGRYQQHHRVYAREGEKCDRCGQSEVRRIVQCQRATFFCPGCQKKRS